MINIEETKKTPKIYFSSELGKGIIKGVCIPENPTKVYETFNEEINNYIINPSKRTVLDIELLYINTASMKALVYILNKLQVVNNVTINWVYEEDDELMLETGEDINSVLSKCKFNFIEIRINS